jgi:hypothetical protein
MSSAGERSILKLAESNRKERSASDREPRSGLKGGGGRKRRNTTHCNQKRLQFHGRDAQPSKRAVGVNIKDRRLLTCT